jgi:hypothetical protein
MFSVTKRQPSEGLEVWYMFGTYVGSHHVFVVSVSIGYKGLLLDRETRRFELGVATYKSSSGLHKSQSKRNSSAQ